MSNHTALLQAKADAISIELANYESDKANLEVAQRAGAAHHASSLKLVKLKGKIKGAKLRLSNAEKKIQEALALRVEPFQQDSLTWGSAQQESSPDTSDSSKPGHVVSEAESARLTSIEMGNNKPTQSQDADIPRPIDVDDPSLLCAVPQSDAKESSEADTSVPTPVNLTPDATINPPPISPSYGVSPSLIFPKPLLEIPESHAAQVPSIPTTDVSAAVLDSGVPPSRVTDVTNNYRTTFKRLNVSESDDEPEDDPMGSMNLMTAADRLQLQQLLFKAGFTKAKPPKKRVKYVEVPDDSDGTGDPAMFDDGTDSEFTNDAGLTQRSKAVHTKLPLASKGKGREKKAEEKEGEKEPKSKGREQGSKGEEGVREDKTSKRKGRKKELKGDEKSKAAKSVDEKDAENIESGDGTAAKENSREGYRASAHSTEKAARAAATLLKRQERLTDEEAHRRFVEAWLDAPSAAQRPEFPRGIDLIRTDPDYLPAVATINYRLTLELMLNQATNFLCLPHVKLDRKIVSHVDNLEGPIRIWGTPLPRDQNTNINSNISRPSHHFHCGCNEKVALAGFVMWKTWKAKAMVNGQLVVEGLHQHKPFQPREVLFILQFLKSKFGYTVEDMFTGSFDEEEELRKEAHVMKKVANFCARRHFELIGEELTLDKNIEILEEELVPEWI